MTIGIFTCFKKIYVQNLKFGTYRILRGAYIRESLYSEGNSCQWIEGLICGGLIFGVGLYSGFYGIFSVHENRKNFSDMVKALSSSSLKSYPYFHFHTAGNIFLKIKNFPNESFGELLLYSLRFWIPRAINAIHPCRWIQPISTDLDIWKVYGKIMESCDLRFARTFLCTTSDYLRNNRKAGILANQIRGLHPLKNTSSTLLANIVWR